jgi:hypothetical protein
VFVATVVAQNVIRARNLPADDASAGKVDAYYSAHLGTTELLTVLYVIGAVGLMLFLGTLLSRLTAAPVRAPAFAGAFGGTGIVAMFTMTVATDVALAEYVHRGAAEPGVTSALWVLHNAVFGLLLVSIAIALVALSAAVAGAGMVPEAWKGIGLLGGVLLAIAGASTPAIVGGSKVIAFGLLGFLAWLGFVTVVAVTLLRR